MIRCKSKYAMYNRCVIDMDEQQNIGGIISCDTAEDLNFNRVEILRKCECAEPADIHDAALKELWS